MQKIYKVIILTIIFLSTIVDVKANWTNVTACPEGTTELKTFLQSDMQGVDELQNYKDYCVKDNISPSQVSSIISSSLSVCSGNTRPVTYNSTTYCCPENTYIDKATGMAGEEQIFCVPNGTTLPANTWDIPQNSGITNALPSTSSKLGSEMFPKKTDGDYVICKKPNCYIKNGELASPETISRSESQKHKCIAPGTEYEINGEKRICNEGKLLTESENQEATETQEAFANLPDLLGACEAYKEDGDMDEYNKCVKCYEKCRGQEACPLVYNALGCIDTNPNGLITRTFQIGIGLMGGLGLVRLIQAAILRQTNDPSKIKEASEMFTSVLIGGVLLIFGIIILRFIGINVLQIMPDDFLSFGE